MNHNRKSNCLAVTAIIGNVILAVLPWYMVYRLMGGSAEPSPPLSVMYIWIGVLTLAVIACLCFPIYFAILNKHLKWVIGVAVASVIFGVSGVFAIFTIGHQLFSKTKEDFDEWKHQQESNC